MANTQAVFSAPTTDTAVNEPTTTSHTNGRAVSVISCDNTSLTEAINRLTMQLSELTIAQHLLETKFDHFSTFTKEVLRTAGIDPNKQDEKGRTALHKAARRGDVEAVGWHLEIGASVDAQGITPLYLASQEGHVEVVKLLINKKADVRKQTKGKTALDIACEKDHDKVVAAFIAPLPDGEIRQSDGQNQKTLQELIKKGKALTDIFVDASKENNIDFVEFLLRVIGIDIDAGNKHNYTALAHAIKNKNKEMVCALLKHKVNIDTHYYPTALHQAIAYGFMDLAQFLIRKGANATSKKLLCALKAACRCDSAHHVSNVLKVAANTDIPIKIDADGIKEIFTLCCQESKAAALHALLIGDICTSSIINDVDKKGQTELENAAERGDEKIVLVLLYANAEIKRAYDLACAKDRGRIVEIFINLNKIEINAVDERKRTKLHYAAENNTESVAQALVNYGINVALLSKGGRTARAIATDLGYGKIVTIIDSQPKNLAVPKPITKPGFIDQKLGELLAFLVDPLPLESNIQDGQL